MQGSGLAFAEVVTAAAKTRAMPGSPLPASVMTRAAGLSRARTGLCRARPGFDAAPARREPLALPGYRRTAARGNRRGGTHAHIHTPTPTGNQSCPLQKSCPAAWLRRDTRGPITIPAIEGGAGLQAPIKAARRKPSVRRKGGTGQRGGQSPARRGSRAADAGRAPRGMGSPVCKTQCTGP